jgi:predicted N-formylglutamate amidohydrolase
MTNHAPFLTTGTGRKGPWLIACDHASNHVPNEIDNGSLGLTKDDMHRHIAYDLGAKGLSQSLGNLLDAPVLCSNFSRLVIDPNRGEDDPTLLMKLYDGTIIPGNHKSDTAELDRRIRNYYRPYHQAYSKLAAKSRAILAVHSFTPQLRGHPPRPWEVGVLFGQDRRLADAVIARLRLKENLVIGVNEPYAGHLPGDSIDQHAQSNNKLNILIEVRNDLIKTISEQNAWARFLAPVLQKALLDTEENF